METVLAEERLREEQCNAPHGTHHNTHPQPAVWINQGVLANNPAEAESLMQLFLEFPLCVLGRDRLQDTSGQHLRRIIGKVHRNHGRTIERVKIQALALIVWVDADCERLVM